MSGVCVVGVLRSMERDGWHMRVTGCKCRVNLLVVALSKALLNVASEFPTLRQKNERMRGEAKQ